VAGTIVVLAIIGAVTGGGSDTSTAPATSAPAVEAPATPDTTAPAPTTPKAAASPSLPAVGSEVRDGKFAFTVVKVKRGVASVGSQYVVAIQRG